MFRGKESSNRIELSQLVQELLNLVFWAPCSSGGGGWVDRGGGCPLHTWTCTSMHAHGRTHIYTCIEIANGCQHGGIHVYNMFNMHVRACVYMCAWYTPHTPIPIPTPYHPSAIPQGGGPPESLKI